MFSSLRGKNVLVTGGSSGIGLAICKKLADYGLNVFMIYNSTDVNVDILNSQLAEGHGTIYKYRLNVNDEERIREVLSEIENEHGFIPYVVNCAGITRDNYMLMMDTEEWNSVINTNLSGAFHVTQTALTNMIVNHEGSIVNISSIAGFMGVTGQANYCAAKAGLIGFTKALAKEMASKNIRVNAIAPGYIDTKMIEKVKNNGNLVKSIPMRRFGTGEDVANSVLFLLSDGAQYITGTTIVVDGGVSA